MGFPGHTGWLRYAWIAVVSLTIVVPALLIPYGYQYNVHTDSTVGGPLTPLVLHRDSRRALICSSGFASVSSSLHARLAEQPETFVKTAPM